MGKWGPSPKHGAGGPGLAWTAATLLSTCPDTWGQRAPNSPPPPPAQLPTRLLLMFPLVTHCGQGKVSFYSFLIFFYGFYFPWQRMLGPNLIHV